MIKVEKIVTLLFFICMLVFTSCSNNTLPESTAENTTEYLENTDKTEITEDVTEKNTGSSETVVTRTMDIEPLSVIDFKHFKSMMSEDDYAALEGYFPVLNEDLTFNFHGWRRDETDNVEINLNELREKSRLVRLYKFTVCDLDNDDVKELILCFDYGGEMLIFHKESEDFFAKKLPFRGFKQLQKNGVYNSSGEAPCSHYLKLFFENGKFSETELGHGCAYEDDMFVVNGNPVSEEEFAKWKEEIMIGEVEWYYSK